MPFSNLPEAGFKLWEKIHDASIKAGDSEEVAAKKAWAGLKNAGWEKGTDGKWHKKSDYVELSLIIKSATLDKGTGQMNWKADCSDTETDSYDDSMTQQLFADFLARIESKELPPAEFCSSFWAGGTPYLSISHYSDLDGNGVPGEVKAVYVDGNYLKAKGTFSDTPLGRACFRSVCEQLYSKADVQLPSDKVRISIGFLDWAHKHKSNGFEFHRSDKDEMCPECFKEILMGMADEKYQRQGKYFLNGHLIHLALTRVPVNKRTIMEVDKSMTTQVEDAASIVGEELAKDLEEKAKMIGKSEVLVTKSEETVVEKAAEKCPKCGKDMSGGKCPECDAEGMEEEGCAKKKKSEFDEMRSYFDAKFAAVDAKIAEISVKAKVEPTKGVHPLDPVFDQFRSMFDATMSSDATAEAKLRSLQESYSEIGKTIVSLVAPKKSEPAPVPVQSDLVAALSEVMRPVAQKLDLLSTQLSDLKVQPVANTAPVIPQRMSVSPKLVQESQAVQVVQSSTPKLHALLEGNLQRAIPSGQ